jgi:hypothetical protein
MIVMVMKKILFFLSVAGSVISCAPDSKITSAWKNASRTKSYGHVVVVALTHDVNAKTVVERDLSGALEAKNVTVMKSLDIFPPAFTKDITKEDMLGKIRLAGADAILTVSMINKETKTSYVPGSPGYVPGFWGYYSYWGPTVYRPGYYTEDRVYYMETNLYDASTDELVWSAQSETYNPSSITGFSKELAKILANRLQKDKIITPASKLSAADKKIESRASN